MSTPEKQDLVECDCTNMDATTGEIEHRFACECSLDRVARPGCLDVPTSKRNVTTDSLSPRSARLSDIRLAAELELSRSQANSTGTIKFQDGAEYKFTSRDLIDQGEIGKGAFATVNRMVHESSGKELAVKRIRSTINEDEQKKLLAELDVMMSSNDCAYIVRYLGALFWEGDCWICMELMELSLDKFYKFVFRVMLDRLPEPLLASIAHSGINALNYLHENLQMLHRDVKPSNILLDRRGNIKLCDFGISGQLVDIIAKSRDAGCRPYMAPERIDPNMTCDGYDLRSDVWSFGITMIEVSTGKFPYPKWNSAFEQLDQVLFGEPPKLAEDAVISPELSDFVQNCLVKDILHRASYTQLMKHKLFEKALATANQVPVYVADVLSRITDRSQLDFDAVDSA